MADLDQAAVEAVAIRLIGGPDRWERLDPMGKFRLRDQVLAVLNAASADGWSAPVKPCAALCGKSNCTDFGCMAEGDGDRG